MDLVIVLVVAAIVAVIVYLYQMQNWHGPIVNFLIVTALLLVVASIVYVYAKTSADITNFMGFVTFVKLYFQWVASFLKNAAGVTGRAVDGGWGFGAANATGA